MKTNRKEMRGFTLVELLVVIVIIASLAGLTAPMVIRQRKKADATEATNNARQIGLALFEFETENGSYPDNSTGTTELLGDVPFAPAASVTTAEDAFRQLFIAGITQSEDMFYAKISGAVKPDGVFDSATTCLEDGENGFAYVMDNGGTDALSTGGNPSRALIVTPMVSATNFDPDPFDGKAIYLKIDNSVSQIRIRDDAGDGTTTLFDTGTNSVWGTDAPAVIPQVNVP